MTAPGRLPGVLYHVIVDQGGRKLKFREKGGGTFRQKKEAVRRLENLRGAGVRARLFATETHWEEVE